MSMAKKVISFGEMLWDCFPDYDIAGGAPMNVALNLKQLGLDIQMISRIGKDEYGQKLKAFVQSFGLPTVLVQVDDTHMTGKVIVDNKDKENIKYDIVSPVAWDFIELTSENKNAVAQADAFIFGSLAIRNNRSWETLFKLLHIPTLKIFDINLRAPYFDFEKIEIIFGYTDILKVNEEELQIVADHFGIASGITFEVSAQKGGKDSSSKPTSKVSDTTRELCAFLSKHFPIKMICITLGSRGALIYQNDNFTRHHGYKVQVEDTVGSGDAFLSGFVKTYLEEKSLSEILDFSCAMGAFVATKRGGTPRYGIEDVGKTVNL